MSADLNDRDRLILKTALVYAKANISEVNEAMGLAGDKMGAYEPFKEGEYDELAAKLFMEGEQHPFANTDPEWKKRVEEEIRRWRANPTPFLIAHNPATVSIETEKPPIKDIIHTLSGRRATCGFPGAPKDWPEGHRRIVAGNITCPGCVETGKKATEKGETP